MVVEGTGYNDRSLLFLRWRSVHPPLDAVGAESERVGARTPTTTRPIGD